MKKILANKRLIFTVFSIILVVIILMGTTYAVFFKVENLSKNIIYTSGILDITSTSASSTIDLASIIPMDDSDGVQTEPYIYRITNNGNVSYKFDVKLLSTTTENMINPDCIRVKVDDAEPVNLSSLVNGLIKTDVILKPGKYIDGTIRVWLSKANTRNTELGKSFSGSIITDGVAVENIYSNSEIISDLTQNSSTTSLYTINHASTTDVPTEYATAYRYRGKRSDGETANYVSFNNELWNIFGWFDTETPIYTDGQITGYTWERRMKIIKNGIIGNYPYDSGGSNDWSTASLNTYLNSTYYNSLTDKAKSMIEPAKFYLGGFRILTLNNTAVGIYSDERSTSVSGSHSTTWTGNIALPYGSDIGYSATSYNGSDCSTTSLSSFSNGCSATSWLTHEDAFLSINPVSSNSNQVGYVTSAGSSYYYSVKSESGVKPVVYLKSDVKILSGDGTYSNPYTLVLE